MGPSNHPGLVQLTEKMSTRAMDYQDALGAIVTDGLLEWRNSEGRSLLQLAAIHGHTSLVKALVDRGATMAQVRENERTPMAWAAAYGRVETARELLEAAKGANIAPALLNARDWHGNTPLMIAARNGQSTLELFLREIEPTREGLNQLLEALGHAREKLDQLNRIRKYHESERPGSGDAELNRVFSDSDGGPIRRAERNLELLLDEIRPFEQHHLAVREADGEAPASRLDKAFHRLGYGMPCDTWYETLGLRTEDQVKFADELTALLDQPSSFIGQPFFAAGDRFSNLISWDVGLFRELERTLVDNLPPSARRAARFLVSKAIEEGIESRNASIRQLATARSRRVESAFRMLGAKPFDNEWTILGVDPPALPMSPSELFCLILDQGKREDVTALKAELASRSDSIEAAFLKKLQKVHETGESSTELRQAAEILRAAEKRASSYIDELTSGLNEVERRWDSAASATPRSDALAS